MDGGDPAPGVCPGCGSRYAGDGDSAPDAVQRALDAWGLADVDSAALTSALFALPPGSGSTERIAVVSDERDGFYRWWLFAPLSDDETQAAIRAVGGGAPPG